MPSLTLRWLRAICGALTMAFFAFGVTFILCQKFSNVLEWILPSVAVLLVLVYMPRILYMWALNCDVAERRLYLALNRAQKREDEDDDESEEEFPLEGHDGSDIRRKF